MPHSSESFAAHVIKELKGTHLPQAPQNDSPLVEGAYFSWDSDEGEAILTLKHVPDLLFTLEAKVTRHPRWFSFNLSLGEDSFVPGDVLGVVAKFETKSNESFPFFVRTSRENADLADTHLQEGLTGGVGNVVQTALHTFEPFDAATQGPGFHTLVMQLPPRDFTLELRDLRVFVLPAARGLRSTPAGLASLGA